MLTIEQLAALGADIASDDGLSKLPTNSDGDEDIARAYNVIVGQGIKSRMVTARAVLAELGADGATILDKLEQIAPTVSMVKWAMKFLFTDGIDVGHPNTVALLNGLSLQGALSAGDADALIGLARQDETRAERLLYPWTGQITARDISAARSL